MHDRGAGASGMGTAKRNEFPSRFETDQHAEGDDGLRRAPCEWMPRGGRGRRRAMMAMMMMNPSSAYGMNHGFVFGGRGGRRGRHGGWSGSGDGGRRHGHGGRRRGRHGRMEYVVDDGDENVASMADQMNECHMNEVRKRHGSGSSESSSSSSSSSESDDENAPDVGVKEQQPHDQAAHDGEVHEMEGQSSDQAHQETNEADKEQELSSSARRHGKHGCRHGRGHQKHRLGKRKHHRHAHFHITLTPRPMAPHPCGFNRPPIPPMYHHLFHDHHGNHRMGKKFFKKSMKQWFKAQKKAWKQQGKNHQQRQRSDGDETTSGCENDEECAHEETRCQLPPPWLFFEYDHHGRGHRPGFCRRGKKGEKLGKRLGERQGTATEDAAATKTQEEANNDVEKVHEIHDESDGEQAPMEEVVE